MATAPYPQIVMLGPTPQTHGDPASVVEAYRSHGLFRRWPIDYVATHASRAGARRNASLALGAVRRLLGLFARSRAPVVHLHAEAGAGFWRDALFMALVLAARCPLIVQLHGAGFERLSDGAGPLRRHAVRILLERAACTVVPSHALRAWVASVARAAHVVRLPHPVSPAGVQPEDRRPDLVLFLSRLEAATGAFEVLEAVAALRAALPDLRLVFAGDGERRALRLHAERLGVGDAVHFTGWVGPSGRRALLESAAVFALPSYEDGLSMGLLEAMAAGVAVVASPVGGVAEVLANGTTGFLVAPGDIATLQRLLRKLLLDPGLAARVGMAARESVRRRCAPERVLATLEALYAALGVHALVEPRSPLARADLNEAA